MLTIHSNNVNIAAIKDTKPTNKTKPLKTRGLAAVRFDRRRRPANADQRHNNLRQQHGRSSSVSRSSSGAKNHYDYDAQSPTAAHPQHLHSAT